MSGSIAGRFAGGGKAFADGVDWAAWSGHQFERPTQTGLHFWVRADDLELSDGASVASWADRSIQANDLSQATAADQPTYREDFSRGLPAVEFNSDFMHANGVASLVNGDDTPITLFYAIERVSPGSNDFSWSFGNSSDDNPFYSMSSGENESNDWRYVRRDDSGTLSGHIDDLGLISGVLYLFVIRHFSDGTFEVRKNGEVVISNDQSAVDTLTCDQFALGCLYRTSAGNFFQCAYHEFGIYDRAVSDAEAAEIEYYLNDRYQAY